MGRLIDADELEEDMFNLWKQNEISNGEWIQFREILNQQPTAPQWIPVTERLPEKDGDYIVTHLWIGTYSCEAYREIGMDEWRRGEWVETPNTYEVVAWMPLPSPYKE